MCGNYKKIYLSVGPSKSVSLNEHEYDIEINKIWLSVVLASEFNVGTNRT